jgi:REP element-mobilizing transposase RayT
VRHPQHDYSLPGAYFVTFVTRDRGAILGQLDGNRIELSTAGTIVQECWASLPRYFEGLTLDAFQIMPDHVHCIVCICAVLRNGVYCKPGYTLSKVIGALKANSARKINTVAGTPGRTVWQDSFSDRVVRDDEELEKFRRYIENNPFK